MNLQIITTESEFIDIKQKWNALTNEPLASWAWNYWWWKHLGQYTDLRIILLEKDNRTIGIAPLMIETRRGERRLRFLGSGSTCTDYVQLIAKEDDRTELTVAVADEIKNNPQFDVALFELEGATASPGESLLGQQLHDSFWRYDQELESSWACELPPTWDEFVQQRHRSLRRKIRKAEKRYAKGEARAVSTRDGLCFDTAFDKLVELHQMRFVSKGESGVFSDPNFAMFLRAAIEELCEIDRAEIIMCSVGDRPIVTHLYLRSDSGPQLYQSGIDSSCMRLEPGHLLFTNSIQRAIEEGCSRFDFLRGNEHYKSLWGGEPVPLFTIRYVSKNLSSTVTHQLIRGAKKFKRACADFSWFGLRSESTT